MSGDRPITSDMSRPVRGTAAGTAYLALPPTAVDARAASATRLVVAWPGFDAPRTAAALASAVPMTGVPIWRVYLDLPAPEGRPPTGLGSGGFLESHEMEAYGAAVEQAVERLPAALAELRRDLGAGDGPVGLAGFSAGASVALLALARGVVPVSTAALVAPIIAPSRAVQSLEQRAGRERAWSERAAALAELLDLGARARDISERGAALLLIGGAKDRVVPPTEITALRDLLRRCGNATVESATFRMGHALAAEPGTDARPPITEAVRVDGVLSDWFRERLAEVDPRFGYGPPADETRTDLRPVPAGPPAASAEAPEDRQRAPVEGPALKAASGRRG